MKVSIAMATYNGAQYLEAQLTSFINQTRMPDELIITDDNSTDETESIVKAFSKIAPFKVEFHTNKGRLGYCGNFNSALLKTTGDWVFLSDQDDVWFQDKIAHMLQEIERNPDALVLMNDASLTDGNLQEVGLTKIGQIRSSGLGMDSFVMGCCSVVSRKLLDICLPIPSGLKAHDNWLVEIADALGAKHIDGRTLQFYRRHEDNESQFIANRTTKVTRTSRYVHTLKGLFNRTERQKITESLTQKGVFVCGLRSAINRSPKEYKKRMEQLLKNSEKEWEVAKARISIRKRSLIPRGVGALKMFLKGDYKYSSGIKSVIRDFIG